MFSLTLAVLLTVTNLVYAATIYLSLHGWLVSHDTSGMQLLIHLIITAPVVLITTAWFFYLSQRKNFSAFFWKVNLVGILIPVMSIQTGVTHYHFDKIGLAISLFVATAIIVLFVTTIRRSISF